MGYKEPESFDIGGVIGGVIGGINTVIPEFYYDLLARILPGLISLLAVLVAAGVINPTIALERMFTLTMASVIALYIALAACGYVVGIVLTYFQRGIRWLYIPRVWRQLLATENCKHLIKSRASELKIPVSVISPALDSDASKKAVRNAVTLLYGPLHDLLKERHPQARLVLDKMNGEAGLCESLVVGLLLTSLVLCWRVFAEGLWRSLEMWLIIGLLLAVIFLFLVAQYRYKHMIERHFCYWSILRPSNEMVRIQ
jgi:hypothetical protein